MQKAEIGLIGLAVMGANLARNIAGKKIHTVVFNRTTEKTEEFIKEYGHQYLTGEKTIKKFIERLERPRKIILMVKSGQPVDDFIEKLLPHLQKDDIILDCGNTNYKDTLWREAELSKKGIHMIGCGVSGGEEGALNGPSMMPGGSNQAYKKIEKILIAASANDGIGGKCVTYVGKDGSGHFVKMVHNGIEYGIMQIIAEIYQILKEVGGLKNTQLQKLFESWSKKENSKSFLVEITADIFKKGVILDKIKDAAQQKGTGKWTTFAAMDYGVSTPTINSAVDARIISGDEMERKEGTKLKKTKLKSAKAKDIINLAKDALDLATICTYYQGFKLMRQASIEYNWNLDLSEIARIWRGGCIIRSDMLGTWSDIFNEGTHKSKTATKKLHAKLGGTSQKNWRKLIILGIENGIPMPALSASLTYYDAITSKRLPQNLIQAQRDYFGAHTYQRTDKKGIFHTDWS